MKVLNVAGFPIKFEKEGVTYRVPNDGRLHMIPDKCYFEDNFDGLLRVIEPPQNVKQTLKQIKIPSYDINEPEIKEIIFNKIEEEETKPLKRIKIKESVRARLKKTNKKEEVKTE